MAETTLGTVQLGSTGLAITRIGFGAWALGGGDWEFGWGDQDDSESIDTIGHALALGINWIDTAAGYGFGHSEQVVGRAIAGLRPAPHVFTKCGLVEGPGRTVLETWSATRSAASVRRASPRLGVEAIDLYQIHWPRPPEDIEQGWSALTCSCATRGSCATSASPTWHRAPAGGGSARSRRSRRCSRPTRSSLAAPRRSSCRTRSARGSA